MPSEDSLFVDGTRPAGRSWRLRGHVFLSSWTKTKTKRLSLQSKSTGYNEVTRYTVEMDVPRTSYLAFHGGVSYQNLAAVESVSYGELALGVAWSAPVTSTLRSTTKARPVQSANAAVRSWNSTQTPSSSTARPIPAVHPRIL